MAEVTNRFMPNQTEKDVGTLLAKVDALEAKVRGASLGLEAVQGLMDESRGVYGLHLNDAPAPWGSLQTGGEYEGWLEPFDAAITALEKTK